MSSWSYNVFVSKQGNVFMAELATMLADGLADLGREATLRDDGLPEPTPGVINVVVAPHEYFTLLRGYSDRSLMEAASASVCIGTEQPGTTWFELSAKYAAAAALALDINEVAVAELRRRGIRAQRLPLGYHPAWDHWHGDTSLEKSRDIVFLGAVTPHRVDVFSNAAPLLWDYRCELLFFDFDRPVTAQSNGFVTGSAKYDLLARSKILLNLHRSETPYFEWVRVLEAMANGCVVLSEPSEGYEPLVPGEHFIQAPADTLIAYAVSLLSDPASLQELSTDAYQFVKSKLAFTDILHPIVGEIENAAPPPGKSARLPVRTYQPGIASPARHADPAVERASQLLGAILDTDTSARARIKDLLVAEIRASRTIEDLQAMLRYGSPNYVGITTTTAYEVAEPEVSVVLSLYNYDSFVLDAIESVVHSAGIVSELIVVDDHSRDGSVSVVKQAMNDHDWYPMLLVEKVANHGLSAARNAGFARARAPYVFVLDADNRIFPKTLAKLTRALSTSKCAFAYAPITKFGVHSGLLSYLPWNIERLTLANYIDAMALIRRDVWQDLGGYDESLFGWEDYEFWLRLAANDMEGLFVPEILAEYRAHETSMLATVNLDTLTVMADFRERYPYLPWPAR